MAYLKDSEGDDVQCDKCDMYPAEHEHVTGEGTPDEEWHDLCADCYSERPKSVRDPILGCASKAGYPCDCGLDCTQC